MQQFPSYEPSFKKCFDWYQIDLKILEDKRTWYTVFTCLKAPDLRPFCSTEARFRVAIIVCTGKTAGMASSNNENLAFNVTQGKLATT